MASKIYLEQSQSIQLSGSQKSGLLMKESVLKLSYFHEVKNYKNFQSSKEKITFRKRTWLVDREEKNIE